MLNHLEIAKKLDKAASGHAAVAQLSNQIQYSVDDAYDIQLKSIQQRISRGENLVGLKMGFTSEAKMKQMGVHDMIWGLLTDQMHILNGGELDFSKFIHPRAEPEICFYINQDISEALSVEEVKECVDGVSSAIEVIDSRYENFKFSLEDVIADNCSSAAFVLGEKQDKNIDLSSLAISLEIDGDIIHKGNSSAILGDPWKSLAAATRLAHKYEHKIAKGSIVLAGAATAAVYLKPGNKVKAIVEGMGDANMEVD